MDTQKKERLGTMILEHLALGARRSAHTMNRERTPLVSRLKPPMKKIYLNLCRMLQATPVDF